jgi:hypothetical protein
MDDAPEPRSTPAIARRTLLIGAAGASAVVSIRPALAQVQASVMNCEIPVPDQARAGRHIAADGTVVAPGTPGAFAPANRAYTGEEVRRAMQGMNLPGADGERTRAYTNYIRKLQSGTSGFTCFASLQMPRG